MSIVIDDPIGIAEPPPHLADMATMKAVVVHAGARDSYQLAQALYEAGSLDALVTDLFWPSDRAWAARVASWFSPSIRRLLERRSNVQLPSRLVLQCMGTGLRGLLLDRLPGISFEMKRKSGRAGDATLGTAAGLRAKRKQAGLVSYSYYGYDAIEAYGGSAMLFQVHPHPATVRRLLNRELALHPDCASSLQQEWELALPEEDFNHLVQEPRKASRLLAASTFTRDSLIEQGIPSASITVVPYGVDLERFRPATQRAVDADPRLHLLFVGRINQRKGIKYLLEALTKFTPDQVRLTVCGRVVDDLALFEPFASQVSIRPSVGEDELVKAYQSADLFVFPSVAEGFGQVLLESLACGLPILSTTHTAAPDLITDGVEGFIVEPGRSDLLADRIEWVLSHRTELAAMHIAARRRAEHFTWARFRAAAANAVREYLHSSTPTQSS